MKRPRILLAGISSGGGKTTVVCGLLAALKQSGYRVQAFKCGPDYIDPMFHRTVLDTASCNLDPWFCDGSMLRWLLQTKSAGADISVAEGVMGYYDGLGGTSDRASTYEVARETGTPVILVVDARGMSKSLVPLVRGFVEYKKDSCIAGVIFNRMSKGLYPAVKHMMEEELAVENEGAGIRVLGYVPELPEQVLMSRHLGLVLPEETQGLKERLETLGRILSESLDMEAIVKIAQKAEPLEAELPESVLSIQCMSETVLEETAVSPVRIGVAQDRAFCFLYPENLQVLKAFGAEPVYFSPLNDEELPEGISGLLLCGGYPELYAKKLEHNTSMRRSVLEALEGGMPCLAECGGFLYLNDTLETGDRQRFHMAGVLKGNAFPAGRLVRFGYICLEAQMENPYLPVGGKIRAHEFHYWDCEENGRTFTATKASGSADWECMVRKKRILAGFPHLYYYSNPEIAERFVRLCRIYERETRG